MSSGLTIGDIDLGDKVIDHEFRIKFLFKILEWIVNNNKLRGPSPEEMKKMKEEIVKQLKTDYPKAGIEFKEKT